MVQLMYVLSKLYIYVTDIKKNNICEGLWWG